MPHNEMSLNSAPNQGFAVVELFTSQGCSSCPPADAVLKSLHASAKASKQAIFVLSFHVDYWNHLGWKDPYSSKTASDRQRRYGQALRTESIYTPQMIVNGQAEFVGSEAEIARAEIAKALKASPNLTLQSSVQSKQGSVLVEYALSTLPSNAVLNIAVVRDVEPLAVRSGENRGRNLSHTQVVRAFETIPLTILHGNHEIRLPNDVPASQYRIIAYVQDSRSLHVLAGAAHDVP